MAAVNKNFVIKNGLEVDTDLILADSQTNKVGIGTTAPQYTLHVNGGIGVTNAYVSGITTVINELRVGTGGTIFSVIAGPVGVGQSVGVGTANPAFLLDVRSPVSTGQTALYVQGDIRVTGDLNIDDISITNLNVSGISTFVGFATFRNNIFVAGISTFVGFATFGNNVFVAGVGTITTLNSTSGTITNLTGTAGTITTLNSTSGTITNLTGTAGTITTFNSTNGTITNLTGTAGTITTFNSTNGTITNLTNTNLNVSGVSTFVGFATFRNNIFVAGISTFVGFATFGNNVFVAGISTFVGFATFGNNVFVAGVGTITTLNSTSGTITNLTNTNLNVTGVATIATLNATTVTISGAAVTNFTVSNSLSVGGISTFTNGPIFVGSGTSTGTASQRLQVTGGTYVSGNLGIGSTNPTSKLHVVGDGRFTGVVTATTFVGALTGTASSTTNIPNLTGAITSNNTTTTLGSFSSANLAAALTDETGSGSAVFATSPTLVTPVLGAASASSINVSGISTLGTVKISSGIITATSGVVTYFGDGSYLTGTASNPNLQTVLNTGNTSSTGFSITGVSTLTTLNSTSGTITNLTGTAGTITTLNSTSGTITNLTGTAGTITTFNSTNGTITNLTGTAGTITTFNSTNGTITNLTGTAGTITNISGTNVNLSGVITATSYVISGGTSSQFLKANGSVDSTSYTTKGIAIAMSMIFK